MAYATLMVHLELGRSNAALLLAAGDLAESMHASVIGIATCQTMPLGYGDNYFSGDVSQQFQEGMDKEFKETETEFRKAPEQRVDTLEWRSMVAYGPDIIRSLREFMI